MKEYQRFKNVAVLGAAGKMGSGILLLSAIEMALKGIEYNNAEMNLYAIDTSEVALNAMMSNMPFQIRRSVEKDIRKLEDIYANNKINIPKESILDDFEKRVLKNIKPSLTIESAYSATLIFEAVSEDENLKSKLLSQIEQNNPNIPWFFTNTSSVPISVINEKADLKGRIIGFHFYNPPAVQKLLEIIPIKENSQEMILFAENLAKRMNKVVVHSNDVAGFIGNGFFIRDAIYGLQVAENLQENITSQETIFIIDTITRDYLMRPMGIFQLMDYVGIDVVHFILKVMQKYIPNELLHNDMLDKMIKHNVKGGQNADGSQIDGFLKYDNGKPVAIWSLETKEYAYITEFEEKCVAWLGEKPAELKTWKEILKSENRQDIITNIFIAMQSNNTRGCKYALSYAKNAQHIGNQLVATKVASSIDDVNTVMKTGFFHLYGPINDLI